MDSRVSYLEINKKISEIFDLPESATKAVIEIKVGYFPIITVTQLLRKDEGFSEITQRFKITKID